MRTIQYDQTTQYIDNAAFIVIKVMVAIFFIFIFVLSFIVAVAITSVCICSLLLKTMLRFVITRPMTQAAGALASGGQI